MKKAVKITLITIAIEISNPNGNVIRLAQQHSKTTVTKSAAAVFSLYCQLSAVRYIALYIDSH